MRTAIQDRILRELQERCSSYAHPVNSQTLSEALNITPSYVREQMSDLQRQQLVAVRRGPKGGYYHMAPTKTLRLQIDDVLTEQLAGSFGTVYPEVVERLNEEQKVIVQIALNGVEVLPDGVDAVSAAEVEEVVIRTQSMGRFAIELIVTAEEYLPKLQGGLIKVASLFHAGREQEAQALFAEAVEGLEWTNSCFSGLGQFAATLGNHELLNVYGDFQTQLVAAGEAMEQQNVTELADLLEYELAETTARGLDCLRVLRDQIEGAGREH